RCCASSSSVRSRVSRSSQGAPVLGRTCSAIASLFVFGRRRRDVPCGLCLGTVDSQVEQLRIDLRFAVKRKKDGLIDLVEQFVRLDQKIPSKGDAFVEYRLDEIDRRFSVTHRDVEWLRRHTHHLAV